MGLVARSLYTPGVYGCTGIRLVVSAMAYISSLPAHIWNCEERVAMTLGVLVHVCNHLSALGLRKTCGFELLGFNVLDLLPEMCELHDVIQLDASFSHLLDKTTHYRIVR